MTVEEFSRLPDDDGPVYHELRNGEIVALPRPKIEHILTQVRLCDLLRPLIPSGSFLKDEIPFQVSEHELRVADVAWISVERWRAVNPKSYLQGAPDLVIEVLSPSNTASEMYEKEQLCLENGSRQFWVVDPIRQQVRISAPDARTQTWKSGQEIELPLFGGARIAVDAIFG